MKDYWLYIILMLFGIGVAIVSFFIAINNSKREMKAFKTSIENLELNKLIDSINRINNELIINANNINRTNQEILKTNTHLINTLNLIQNTINTKVDELRTPIPDNWTLNLKIFVELKDKIGKNLMKEINLLNLEKEGDFIELPEDFMNNADFDKINIVFTNIFSTLQIDYELIKGNRTYKKSVREEITLNPKHHWNVLDEKIKGYIRYNYMQNRVHISIWNFPLKFLNSEKIGGKFGLNNEKILLKFNFGILGYENNTDIKKSYVPEEDINIFSQQFHIGRITKVINQRNHSIEGIIQLN